jgi:hypothetical protein
MSMLRVIEVRVLDDPMTLYRIVPGAELSEIEDGMRSHYELGRLPRGPENRAAAIHMAVSMFDKRRVAIQLAARVPKLGGHVARVDLQPGLGICIAKTSGPAHWSVWGRPAQLASCVSDVGLAPTDP